MNNQPLRLVVVRSPEARATLVEHLSDGNKAKTAQSAHFNATLQVGYFILGVRAAGLAAGPMTGYDAEVLNQSFFPNGEHRVLAVVNIGTPAEDAWLNRLPRLDYDEVTSTI